MIGAPLDGRGRRAVALMAAALVALGAAAGIYLRSTARPPAPPPATTRVSSLFWLSPRVGWVVVVDGQQRSVLFHTVDGGAHWTRQFATVASGVAVRFLDAAQGLMTEPTPFPGINPTLLRSDDGGDHWAPIPTSPDIGSRPSLPFFLDLELGWALVRTGHSDVTEDAEIYRTDDGGISWSVVASVDPITWSSHGLHEEGRKRWLSFRTSADGFLGTVEPGGSAAVSVTHDGGANWRLVPLPPPPGGWGIGDTVTLLPPRVSDEGSGALMLVDSPRQLGRQRVGRAPNPPLVRLVVYHTRDGGETWDAPTAAPDGVDVDLGDPAFLAGEAFVNGSAGWLTDGKWTWVTSDSGRTWTRRGELPSGWSFGDVAAVSDSVAVAQAVAGTEWGLFLTEDGGRTWRQLPSPRT